MQPVVISREIEPHLDWLAMTEALAAGHALPRAEIEDLFLYRGKDTLLTRSAWIDGLGLCTKTATIFPGNAEGGKPSVNGGVMLFSDRDGTLEAVVDFHLVTKWKTAGDSLLAARRLARAESEVILIVGAGTVAGSLIEAYGALFPKARFLIWNRNPGRARALIAAHPERQIDLAPDLEAAVRQADVISCATMSTAPLVLGDWLRPGQHLDLIGAYRPDMRETDLTALKRARVFLDNRHTVLHHIGELKIPLGAGDFSETEVVADYYDLPKGLFTRQSGDEITLFKNGGGAHLDLMTARAILDCWQRLQG